MKLLCHVAFAVVVFGLSAVGLGTLLEPERHSPHEVEVGWASRRLAEALDIPIRENGFTDAIRRLVKSAAKGEVPTFDDTSAMIRLGLEGVNPGRTTESWIARVELRSPLAAGDPDRDVISDTNLNGLAALISNGLNAADGANLKDVALLSKGLLLLRAESDFQNVSSVLGLLKQDAFIAKCLLNDDQRKRLRAWLAEAEARHTAFGNAYVRLLQLVQTCREQQRQPTPAEEAMLIKQLDEVRKVGATSQWTWFSLARTSHAVLRLTGVPAEQEIDTKFAMYLREWEASLPECNAKRWLHQANTAGRDLEPQQFIDGRQLRPMAKP